MDILKLPKEQQAKWLQQRGWEPHPDRPNVFFEPSTRATYYLTVALTRALDECHMDSDRELKPEAPTRKDDAPFPKPRQ